MARIPVWKLTRRIGRVALGALLLAGGGLPRLVLAHPAIDEQLSILERRGTGDECDASAELKRGDLYRQRQEWQRAAVAYERAAACAPQLEAVDAARAQLYLESGDLAAALHFADRYLAAHPNAARTLVVRAAVLQRLGRPFSAVADYSRAIAASSTPQPDNYLERARAQVAAGDLPAAVAGLDEGLARLGPVPALQRLAVDIEVSRRDYAAALRRIDRAVAADAGGAAWLLRRGQVLEQAGRSAEAVAAFDAAIAAVAGRPAGRRQTTALHQIEEQATAARQRLSVPGPATTTSRRD